MEAVKRIVLADTGEEFRLSLASHINDETDMQVVGETGDGMELLHMVRELEPDAYLTYVTQVGDYVVTEYISAQGQRYGLLLDGQCRTLAELPDLCDILADGTLVFDDMRGNLRQCRIYSMQELLTLADQR